MRMLRQGTLIPVPPPEKAVEYLQGDRRAGRQRLHRTGAAGSSAARQTVARQAARGGRSVRGRGADRRDDHARPSGAQALLRADRRGDRARAARRCGSEGRSHKFARADVVEVCKRSTRLCLPPSAICCWAAAKRACGACPSSALEPSVHRSTRPPLAARRRRLPRRSTAARRVLQRRPARVRARTRSARHRVGADGLGRAARDSVR